CSLRKLAEPFLISIFATQDDCRQAAGNYRLAACAPRKDEGRIVGRRFLAADLCCFWVSPKPSFQKVRDRETPALPGSLRSSGIAAELRRSHNAVVSQVMKSSSDSRVRATAKATTVASSRKPRKGTSSGIRSNGSTR